VTALQLLDLACLGVLFGTWLRLTMQAAISGASRRVEVLASLALLLMTASAGMLILDVFLRDYSPTEGDLAMHASLAVWNGLILIGVIRGTSYSVRRPDAP
jgi:hypothetical protein